MTLATLKVSDVEGCIEGEKAPPRATAFLKKSLNTTLLISINTARGRGKKGKRRLIVICNLVLLRRFVYSMIQTI